jgi:hypothetical protein
MNGGGSDVERCGCLFDRQRFAFGWRGRRLVAIDVPMATQIADVVCGEAMTIGGRALLPIENAGNDSVGIVDGQTAHQCHRVLVGAHRCCAATQQIKIDLGKRAAAPTQCQVGAILTLVDSNDDLFEQGA